MLTVAGEVLPPPTPSNITELAAARQDSDDRGPA